MVVVLVNASPALGQCINGIAMRAKKTRRFARLAEKEKDAIDRVRGPQYLANLLELSCLR